MTLHMKVNKKHVCKVTFINVTSKVFISKVFISKVFISKVFISKVFISIVVLSLGSLPLALCSQLCIMIITLFVCSLRVWSRLFHGPMGTRLPPDGEASLSARFQRYKTIILSCQGRPEIS
jgi:hypothetical protein